MPYNERWSQDELNILRKYYPREGISMKPRLPKRSTQAIISRAARMGITSGHKLVTGWSVAEIDTLRSLYHTMPVADLAAKLPHHSIGSIYKQAERLGLRRRAAKAADEDKPFWFKSLTQS